ncbi:hypothetical protein T484DRAFT_1832127 [Baffinella frigidus]|nr:hypothetical protein T484DRAFT_1832127 [Cryptophyta sp. CCMP2293]
MDSGGGEKESGGPSQFFFTVGSVDSFERRLEQADVWLVNSQIFFTVGSVGSFERRLGQVIIPPS